MRNEKVSGTHQFRRLQSSGQPQPLADVPNGRNSAGARPSVPIPLAADRARRDASFIRRVRENRASHRKVVADSVPPAAKTTESSPAVRTAVARPSLARSSQFLFCQTELGETKLSGRGVEALAAVTKKLFAKQRSGRALAREQEAP